MKSDVIVTEPRIVAHTCKLPEHGHEWNPIPVEHTTYWIEGGGCNRPATDVEVAIMRQVTERCIKLAQPFDAYVNVTEIGSTPSEAIKREFGI